MIELRPWVVECLTRSGHPICAWYAGSPFPHTRTHREFCVGRHRDRRVWFWQVRRSPTGRMEIAR